MIDGKAKSTGRPKVAGHFFVCHPRRSTKYQHYLPLVLSIGDQQKVRVLSRLPTLADAATSFQGDLDMYLIKYTSVNPALCPAGRGIRVTLETANDRSAFQGRYGNRPYLFYRNGQANRIPVCVSLAEDAVSLPAGYGGTDAVSLPVRNGGIDAVSLPVERDGADAVSIPVRNGGIDAVSLPVKNDGIIEARISH